jgi:hypothetical protein
MDLGYPIELQANKRRFANLRWFVLVKNVLVMKLTRYWQI